MSERPTRSQVIAAIVTDAVLLGRLKWNEYAADVVRHYHDNVVAEDRLIEFHVATTADNYDKFSRLNTQTVKRLLMGEIRMHVDIEESLVSVLPPEQRDRLLAALVGRYGLLLARQPAAADDAAGQLAAPCDLMRTTATALERIAPMLADNKKIGPEDAPHFLNAIEGINRVVGVCASMSAQIAGAMKLSPPRLPPSPAKTKRARAH